MSISIALALVLTSVVKALLYCILNPMIFQVQDRVYLPSSDRTLRLYVVRTHTDVVLFLSEGGIIMTSEMPVIDMTATGSNIKTLIKAKGLKVAEIQNILGFNTPQSIFKWMRGESMPSIDNLVILAHILNVTIDEIIILN